MRSLYRRSAILTLALAQWGTVCLSTPFPQADANPTNSTSTVASAASSATSSSQPTSTLSSACLSAIANKPQLPSPQIWQACDTDTWLQDFVTKNADAFTSSQYGFNGVFSGLVDNTLSCTFGMSCTGDQKWPPDIPDDNDADAVQARIVQVAISYLNDWYSQAENTLGFMEQITQLFQNDIITKLIPTNLDPASESSGVSANSVLSLLSTVLGVVPNPYTKAIGGVAKVLSLLTTPPKVDQVSGLIALNDLVNQISATGGTQYEVISNSLINGWTAAFNSPGDPLSGNGMPTILANGSWFDYLQNSELQTADIYNTVYQYSYNWVISQVLQASKIMLHAAVNPSCTGPGAYGMTGEICINFEGTTLDIWPVLWNAPGLYAYNTAAFSAPSMEVYGPGSVLWTALTGNNQQLDPLYFFTNSLQCQLGQNKGSSSGSGATLLNTWPLSTVSDGVADDYCLFNVPIVFDTTSTSNNGWTAQGTLAGAAPASAECDASDYGQQWNDPASDVVALKPLLNTCGAYWSLDEYAAIATGLQKPDEYSSIFCGVFPTSFWELHVIGCDFGPCVPSSGNDCQCQQRFEFESSDYCSESNPHPDPLD